MRISPGHIPREVFQARPAERRPRDRPRVWWSSGLGRSWDARWRNIWARLLSMLLWMDDSTSKFSPFLSQLTASYIGPHFNVFCSITSQFWTDLKTDWNIWLSRKNDNQLFVFSKVTSMVERSWAETAGEHAGEDVIEHCVQHSPGVLFMSYQKQGWGRITIDTVRNWQRLYFL